MRLGLVLDGPQPTADASVAEEHGFDLVHVPAPDGTALVRAAALAATVAAASVVADVTLGAEHPVVTAEKVAVTDRLLGGRLVVAAGAAEPGTLAEAVEVLLLALAARPFRHEGERWTVPARLPANDHAGDYLVRVTPAPAQVEVQVWLRGSGSVEVGRRFGLAHLAGRGEGEAATASAWAGTEEALGPASLRLRRPAVLGVPTGGGEVDTEATVAALRRHRLAWGMDIALLALPAGLGPAARIEAIATIGREVWPRVQLDRYPAGLEEQWRRVATTGGG